MDRVSFLLFSDLWADGQLMPDTWLPTSLPESQPMVESTRVGTSYPSKLFPGKGCFAIF